MKNLALIDETEVEFGPGLNILSGETGAGKSIISHRLKVVEIAHEPEFIGDWIVNKSTVIRCRKDSKVEAYCKKFEFAVEYIE